MHTRHDLENLEFILSRNDALLEMLDNQSKSIKRIIEEKFSQSYNDIKCLYDY